MDAGVRRIIVAWLLKNVDGCDDPRVHGKGFAGDLSSAWRYRVGDYRVLCDIRDDELVVFALWRMIAEASSSRTTTSPTSR